MRRCGSVACGKISVGGNQQSSRFVKVTMSIVTRTSGHLFLALVAALSLGLAACGSDETIDVGTPDEESSEQSEALPDAEGGQEVAPESSGDNTKGFTPTTARDDLISLQTTTPDEVIADPDDDSVLLIRFEGAAEPCSGAAVTVAETDADVAVVLETGLDPNAAAMSCIAMVFDYEIAVPLDAPLGDRTITVG